MKIYCAYGAWDYEGNADPVYVGFDIEKARGSLTYKWYDSKYIEVWENDKKIETITIKVER